MRNATPGRFLTLDAMRGLAAIVVMLGHCTRVLDRSGYLAVDFFFLLSGFVIARAYERKLAVGMSFAEFARLRLARIYPMYAIGFAIGLTARLSFPAWDTLSSGNLAVTAVFNALLLPTPASRSIFPINPPAWSLFFELLVNFLFAALLFAAALRTLLIVVSVAGVLLIATFPEAGGIGGLGSTWDTFLPACARTLFSFTAGLVIARLHSRPPQAGGWAVLPMAILLGLLFVLPSSDARAAYDRVVVVVVFPSLVWVASSFEPPLRLQRISEVLGEISFPLYAVHLPLFFWFDHVAVHLNPGSEAWRVGWKTAFFVVILPIAWFLGRKVDLPLRKRLVNGTRARAG